MFWSTGGSRHAESLCTRMRRGRGSLQVMAIGFGSRASTENRGGSSGPGAAVLDGSDGRLLVRLSNRDFLRVGGTSEGSRGRNWWARRA